MTTLDKQRAWLAKQTVECGGPKRRPLIPKLEAILAGIEWVEAYLTEKKASPWDLEAHKSHFTLTCAQWLIDRGRAFVLFDSDLRPDVAALCERMGFRPMINGKDITTAIIIATVKAVEEITGAVFPTCAAQALQTTEWRCACGWEGKKEALNDNPSGIKTCPDCGASGGLVLSEVVNRPEVSNCQN